MRLVALTAIVTFALDQISKWYVVFHLRLIDLGMIDVWPPYLTFRMAWNRGVNFGLLAGDADYVRWGLVVLALAISAWALWWLTRAPQGRAAYVAGGLLVGGAIGNVVDRVLYGAVADFLNMSCCGIENPYAFNVADIAIFAGALGLVVFANDGARGRRRKTP
jgi:signal peptidase II